MNNSRIKRLLIGYLDDSLSESELKGFLILIQDRKLDKEIHLILEEVLQQGSFSGLSDKSKYDFYLKNIFKRADEAKLTLLPAEVYEKSNRKGIISLWTKIAVAASVIMVVTIGSLWLTKIPSARKVSQFSAPSEVTDFEPGGNRALLTLADGSTIILDSVANGLLAQQANTEVMKLDDGQIVYKSDKRKKTEVLYNTMSTPRAGQYKLILPDNSIVWLNAESSIRFPVSFTGKERVVEVSGEAYFEVTENREMPFIVRSKDIRVEVVGTIFNIRAYADESGVQTTLVEGSVLVASSASNVSLTPGQQALSSETGIIDVSDNADIESIIAWKEGLFIFNSQTVDEIISQISRWYNVSVKYDGEAIGQKTFTGMIRRSANLSDLLRMMKQAGITLIVTKDMEKIEEQ